MFSLSLGSLAQKLPVINYPASGKAIEEMLIAEGFT
jgi:hypothetical protein